MASPDVLDFDTLLAPISDEQPTGIDLRSDASPGSLYYAIKDARSSARATERQAVMNGDETARPDWKPVLKHGQKALAERTKDLEVVAYMTEALVRLNGFAGLRDGFRLARELVERYWDGLYPMPDEDGLETRLAPLTSLNGDDAEGTLITPIAQVPLTAGGDEGPFAVAHYQQALALAQVADEQARQRRVEQGAVTLERIERTVAATPESFYAELTEDLTQCQEAYEALCRALEERCGAQAPPSSNIRAALTGCRDMVNHLARAKLPSAGGEPSANGEADGAAAAGPGGDGAPATATGAIRTRDDALTALLKVAEFFRRTEPHTPVSYALEQAVRWGRMSLPDLLTDLIQDESARYALFHRVGIRPPGSEGG